MKIILATDGSEYSKNAIEETAKFAGSGDEIKIVAVFQPPATIATEPFAVSAEYYAELEKQQREHADDNAEGAESMLRTALAGKDVTVSKQLILGSPERSLIEEAENWKADLIVVGSHGYGFWSRMLLGSVSSAVVHHAPCSVLVVRKG
jgi:nucleotide-binding universal stress UspA family protein